MALIKNKDFKGFTASYWKIVDCNVKTGQVMIAPYASKESAKVRENMIDGRTAINVDFPIDVVNPISYAYTKIVESKMEDVTDEEGNVSQVETNWFVDAVNDEI